MRPWGSVSFLIGGLLLGLGCLGCSGPGSAGGDVAPAPDATAGDAAGPGRDITPGADAAPELPAAADGDGDSVSPPADPPRLRAEGSQIVDTNGQPVILRGVNLGGYLFHENYLTAVDRTLLGRIHWLAGQRGLLTDVETVFETLAGEDDAGVLQGLEAALAERVGAEAAAAFRQALDAYLPIVVDDSDLALRQLLERRFGIAGRDALLDDFQAAWVGEADFAWLAAQGFNLVRLPMGYRDLVSLTDAVPPTALLWNERALARVAQTLDAAARHGLYVVLDLQESPGGHNDYAGAAGTLYDDPAMQGLTVELWQTLSERFGHRDVIAAYSLLAEPMAAPSAAARDDMYDALIQALRALGDTHLVVVHDGFRGMGTLPLPSERGWTNVVYSTHLFEWGADDLADYDTLVRFFYEPQFGDAQARHGVPYYIGSFSTMHAEPWAYEAAALLVDWYESHAWSWSLWSYKRALDPVEVRYRPVKAWGLRQALVPLDGQPDAYVDDEATLRQKLATYATLDFAPDEVLLPILREPLQ